ncbi:MAG: toprim domain-containing protein, partial [Acidimicrobiia bacterium]
NRVGADPGPATLRRARGLPRRGPAVVFPVLTDTRSPAYLQARYLDPGRAGRKYDNPSDTLARNPRAVLVCTPRRGASAGALLVCEGLPDALTGAAAGYRAAAVLGAALPDVAVARRITELAGDDPIVVAFDTDEGGRRGAARLRDLLRSVTSDPVTVLAVPAGDLNDWARHSGPAFPVELARQTRPPAPPTPAHPAPHPAPAPTL